MQRKCIIPFLYILVVLCGVPVQSYGKDIENVALFSFNADGAGKYSNLRDGLRAMIAGRLEAGKGISVVENSLSIEQQQAFIDGYPEESASVFSQLNAEYIGAGQLSASGDRLSLLMTFYRENGTAPVHLKIEAENEQQILAAVETLTKKITEEVFGIRTLPVASASPPQQKKGIEAFQTEHPDRRLKEDIVSGAALSMEDVGITIAQGDILRRSSSLADGVIALASGDLDGSGNREIIVVSPDNLKIFNFSRGMLEERAEYPFESALAVHAVNTADLDSDGNDEIYLSAVKNNRLSSMILSWNLRDGVQVNMKDIRWAIRPVNLPGDGIVLAGQSRAQAQAYFLEPGLYILEIEADAIRRGKKIYVPGGINLFDFVHGDIDGDGEKEIISITSRLELAVHSQHNRLLWRSEDDFGGTKIYLGSRWQEDNSGVIGEVANDGESFADLQYVPVRLVAVDINNDGRDEIVSAKNTLSTFKVLKNTRGFSSGKAVCLGWDGTEMQELWSTDMVEGYITGIEYIHYSGEGEASGEQEEPGEAGNVRLVVGQIPNEGFADFLDFSSQKGKLVVYDFKLVDKPVNSIEKK